MLKKIIYGAGIGLLEVLWHICRMLWRWHITVCTACTNIQHHIITAQRKLRRKRGL